jgi:hypothetical protein
MTPAIPEILFISSNARPLYTEDILSVLAAPLRSIIQFRYLANYVSPELRQIPRKELIGRQGLVAFKASDGAAAFVLPIRLVTIADVTIAADIFFFKLRIGNYPNLAQYPSSAQEISKKSAEFLRRVEDMNHSSYYPALTRFPTFPDFSAETTDADSWFTIVRRLSQSPVYEFSHFVRIEPPHWATDDDRILSFDDKGTLRLTEEKPIKLLTHFFSEDTTSVDRKVSCSVDSNFLRVSSNSVYPVRSRYDSVEFWLQPSIVNYPTLTRAEITLDGTQAGDLASRVAFSVIVSRSQPRVAARALLGAFGAFLLAVPAILGPDSDIWLRIGIAVAGAFIVSYVAVYLSAGRK